MSPEEEVIEYRGEKIDVGAIREWVESARNEDGSPYYSSQEAEYWVKRRILEEKRRIGRLTGARFDKHGGYRLGFYLRQCQVFPKAFQTKVDDKTAQSIVKKLRRHFFHRKAQDTSIRFHGNSQSGSYGMMGIRLSHNPSIGLIVHEVAHTLFKRHNKKMLKFMKRMIHYCEKKGWLDK